MWWIISCKVMDSVMDESIGGDECYACYGKSEK